MIGVDVGWGYAWFSFSKRKDLCVYEFHVGGWTMEYGACPEPTMTKRFDVFVQEMKEYRRDEPVRTEGAPGTAH